MMLFQYVPSIEEMSFTAISGGICHLRIWLVKVLRSSSAFKSQIIDAQSKSAPTELHSDEGGGKKRLHRFHKNWNAPIEFVLRNKWSEGESKLFSTTQGRLYTLLWKGGLSVLDSHEALEKPKLYEEAKNSLSYALPHFKDAFSRNFKVIPQSLFILTIDQLQRGVLLKVKKIKGMLGSKYLLGEEIMTPIAAGVPDGEKFIPTSRILGLGISSCDIPKITKFLQDVLYVPPKFPKNTSKFQLKRHGLLAPMNEPFPLCPPKARNLKFFQTNLIKKVDVTLFYYLDVCL